jgi:hypothetical protein
MSKGDLLRQKLYELFSGNLDYIRAQSFVNLEPDINGSYLCPLCIRLFTKKHLDQSIENCLTLEDVPPKSLGGKPLILTCKECNNKSGNKLDEELRKKLIIHEFGKKTPKTQVQASMKFASGLYTSCAMSHRNDGGLNVHLFKNGLKAKRGKRKCFPQISDYLRANGLNDFSLKIKTYKTKHPKIALLRIAYLLAIAKFGYSFLFNDNLEQVRQQIKTPEKEVIKGFGLIEQDDNSYEEGIYLVTQPKELRCFLIIFKLFTENSETLQAVVLPGFNDDSLEIYEKLQQTQERDKKLNFQIRKIPDREYLIERQVCFGPQILWEEIEKSL